MATPTSRQSGRMTADSRKVNHWRRRDRIARLLDRMRRSLARGRSAVCRLSLSTKPTEPAELESQASERAVSSVLMVLYDCLRADRVMREISVAPLLPYVFPFSPPRMRCTELSRFPLSPRSRIATCLFVENVNPFTPGDDARSTQSLPLRAGAFQPGDGPLAHPHALLLGHPQDAPSTNAKPLDQMKSKPACSMSRASRALRAPTPDRSGCAVICCLKREDCMLAACGESPSPRVVFSGL